MEIAWEDFILEEPTTSKSFVQPRTRSFSKPLSRKHSVDSRISKSSGDSNIIYSKSTSKSTNMLCNASDDSVGTDSALDKDDEADNLTSNKVAPEPIAP